MRDPFPRFFASLRLVPGLLIGGAVGCAALTDSDEVAVEPAAAISTNETAPAPLTGQQVYRAVCIACHSPPGVGGAPALGDNAAWAARIAQGKDVLIEHALNGFSGSAGIMPKKGGSLELSDAETVAAIEYMLAQVAE